MGSPNGMPCNPASDKYCCRQIGSQPLGELIGSHRPLEIVTLSLCTLLGLKLQELLPGLHAFRNNFQTKTFPHINYRADNIGVARVGAQTAYERLVNFQGIDWKTL